MEIIIGADIVPVDANIDLFENARIEELIGTALSEILGKADLRIFNLETPLTNKQKPIKKHGPLLNCPTSAIHGIKAMKTDLVTLGNNHIMDQDEQGLLSTMKTLDEAGIMHIGAGRELNEAKEPYCARINGKLYGIYACAEHEFSIAGENHAGANPFDPLESPDHVAQMKTRCDYVIVLYHGGKEHYRYPSPNLQKTCRKLIEKGADLVVCQHSHCIGCEEKYLNGTIVYGQGNFLFCKRDNEYWNSGLLVKINDSGMIDYLPVIRQENGVRLATNQRADEIMDAFHERSREIMQPGYIENRYGQFADENLPDYLMYFQGINTRNGLYRIANKLSGSGISRYIVRRIVKKRGCGIRNSIQCEAHRELLLKGLERYEK